MNLRAKYVYQGCYGLAAIGKHMGISDRTLHSRIKKMGMTVEEAVAHRPYSHIRKQRELAKQVIAKKGVRYPDLLGKFWKLALGVR